MISRDAFREVVRSYYLVHARHDLPWRQPEASGAFDPYKILVSEMMLQQTQVGRVFPKFKSFIGEFPNLSQLAAAPLSQVIIAWQGLGYNRRAKYLWQASQLLMSEFDGLLPKESAQLQKLPGVGYHTARAIMAYAFNEPVVFIETNIRTVFIHHFFKGQSEVADSNISKLIAATLDYREPRQWYWALMDYGAYLKQTVGNVSRSSKAYHVQSKFTGSLRQVRGRALRLLTEGPMPEDVLLHRLADERAQAVLDTLKAEGLICYQGGTYNLP